MLVGGWWLLASLPPWAVAGHGAPLPPPPDRTAFSAMVRVLPNPDPAMIVVPKEHLDPEMVITPPWPPGHEHEREALPHGVVPVTVNPFT